MTATILSIKPKDSAERSEADFRPKGGNKSRSTALHQVLQDCIEYQFKTYPPSWFLVIQWTPAPKDFATTQNQAKHFRNKFLSAVYKCDLDQLPPARNRIKLIWFHERAQDPKGNLIWHSNLHLESLPTPYASSMTQLEWIIQKKVAPRFRCLRHLNRKEDSALMIKPWIYDDHAHYNLKDYYKYKHHQDSDLVLDYLNSDLIFDQKH